MELKSVIISGGGTGGHIFPALAIADEIQRRYPNCKILFVGAQGKMEMEKVPERGYSIEGLQIAGIQRSLSLKNLKLPLLVVRAYRKAKGIIKKHQPDVVIGVGGYASGPTLFAANKAKIPTLLQEQNAFAGLTNKILGKKAKRVCVAYTGMEQFFKAEKVINTGNPVRSNILNITSTQTEGQAFFKLEDKPTLLIIGGSLGARKVNECIHQEWQKIIDAGGQVIWQTGKWYYEAHQSELEAIQHNNLVVVPFIKDMDMAYAAADVVISRAGALSISELAVVGKPVVFVPSPYVAEDHQTKNAMNLVNQGAAEIVKEVNIPSHLISTTLELIKSPGKRQALTAAILKTAKPNATAHIVDEIEKIAK